MTGGSYILLISLAKGQIIAFGRNRSAHFKRGHYAYVGSAMNGLEARVRRHLRQGKKRHWHIDYLLEHAQVIDVILCESESRTECAIAQTIQSHFDSIPGFGSSDCSCPGHLFFDTNKKRLKTTVARMLKSVGI